MGSLRPQRHRKGVYSYREPVSDDDDFSSHSKAQRTDESRAKRACTDRQEQPENVRGRRNLALKKTSRSQERANAKERAEAGQLERAIRESLASDSSKPRRVSHVGSDTKRDVFDIGDSDDDGVTSHRSDSVAFQCLLDVASGADNLETFLHASDAAGAVENVANDGHGGSQVADISKITAEADIDWSHEGEEEDNAVSGEDVNESNCRKKRPKKSPETDAAVAKKPLEDIRTSVQVKKARSSRLSSKGRTPLNHNGCYRRVEVGMESVSEIAVFAQGKENVPHGCGDGVMTMIANTEKSVKLPVFSTRDAGNVAVMIQNCPTPGALKTPSNTSKASSLQILCNDAGSKIFEFQSQKLPHRRVIGLSKRFRPPPLHPYLARPEG